MWISNISKQDEFSNTIESIVIQGGDGGEYNKFILSNLPCLTTLEMGYSAFWSCNSIVFESKNDRMNDEEI